MYECFHCLTKSVVEVDMCDFEEYGIDGEGVIISFHCRNCGADIEYFIPTKEEED